VTARFTPHPVLVVPELDFFGIRRLDVEEFGLGKEVLLMRQVVQAIVDIGEGCLERQESISSAFSKHSKSITVRGLLAAIGIKVER
jgi:hypothetical protein